ncbi:hypothetical protein GCM10008905_16610 [Clostridium malenominatum]|uniref:Uncharacterized protein n=1 Tax=Clostridium malenominatum TaxID=1539 RepID=A0ABP3U3L7_9CLOT
MTAKQDKLFNYYYNLMSEEWREGILNYEDFKMKNVNCSIKVNFKSGMWLRVYQKMNGEIEWY